MVKQERTSGNEQYNDYDIGKIKHVKNQVPANFPTHKHWFSRSTGPEDGELAKHPGVILASRLWEHCWPMPSTDNYHQGVTLLSKRGSHVSSNRLSFVARILYSHTVQM